MSGVGRVSYSLYLWHVVPLLLLQNAWPAAPKPVLGLTVVAATVVLTAASYRYLERPYLRPRSDVLSPPRRGAAAPAGDRTEITPRPESSSSSSSAAATRPVQPDPLDHPGTTLRTQRTGSVEVRHELAEPG